MRCCYCQEPLGGSHKPECIYVLGKPKGQQVPVVHSECNRELKHVEPLDTSKLGPVRVDPNAKSAKARIVREALHECTRGSSEAEFEAAARFAKIASDETLCILGRLLK